MSYASGLQGVGIAIPNPDINLHSGLNIDSIFGWSPTPFTAPDPSGLINPFTGNSTTANPSTALAAAKSVSWEVVAGIAALAWLLTRKR